MRELISYTEALQAVLAAAPSVATESISSYSAFGRVIAEDVTARDNVPPFNNSAMDGFAVIHTDLANTPSTLTIVDDIPAGGLPSRAIAPGLCARIMTGAPIPEGATAIVPIEWTNVEGDSVTIHTAPEDGQHVRLAGADIGSGQVVLSAGTSITPPVSGLLAATGHSMVSVAVRPVVAVVATGDEIVDSARVRLETRTGPRWRRRCLHRARMFLDRLSREIRALPWRRFWTLSTKQMSLSSQVECRSETMILFRKLWKKGGWKPCSGECDNVLESRCCSVRCRVSQSSACRGIRYRRAYVLRCMCAHCFERLLVPVPSGNKVCGP